MGGLWKKYPIQKGVNKSWKYWKKKHNIEKFWRDKKPVFLCMFVIAVKLIGHKRFTINNSEC